MNRWIRIAVCIFAGATALFLLWTLVLSPRVRGKIFRTRVRARLDSPDPAARRDAARSIAANPDPFLVSRIAQAIYGDEQDASVAAAFVAALGRIGDPQTLPAIRFATEAHHAGPVRAAAWLTLAQIDPQEFKSTAALSGDGDEWQTLGIAVARMTLGDCAEVDTILREAAGGDAERRLIAARALDEHVRPLLESIGCWPIDAPETTGEWPTARVTEISQRIMGVDLTAIAAESARAAGGAASIRSTLNRISNGRDRIENWLTNPDNHRWIP